MRSVVLLVGFVAMVAAVPAHAELTVNWFGFAQLTAQQLAEREVVQQDGVSFGADRVRVGMRVRDDKAFGRIHLDINRNDIALSKNGTLPEVVKDAEAGYQVSRAVKFKAGQFKTPLGMDFGMYGAGLDMTKRAMEKQLVLERTVGVMMSGRKIGPAKLGYDLFAGNPAGRSAAHAQGVVGHDQTLAVRGHFDGIRDLHVEAAFAVDQNDTLNSYRAFDVGARYVTRDWTFKAEFIRGMNIRGAAGDDQDVWYGHVGYLWQPDVEFLVRHYQGTRDDGEVSTSLGNTWFGVNYFLGSDRFNGRVQVNYVMVSGDDETATVLGAGKGSGVFVDDAMLAQYQMHF